MGFLARGATCNVRTGRTYTSGRRRAEVKANPKGEGQEGNVTLDSGDGDRVNIRVETHPLEAGGEPVEHANVEVVKTVKGKSRVVSNDHIVE